MSDLVDFLRDNFEQFDAAAAFEVAIQEGEHLRPRLLGRSRPEALRVREVQEGVTGAVVAVELVGLAMLGELGVDLVDVGR